jgi:hypothetical protein
MEPQGISSVATHSLMEYGILGILVLVLGYVMWTSYKRILMKNDELEKKVDALQQEMLDILSEERNRMADLVAKNTTALNELSRIILEYIVDKK